MTFVEDAFALPWPTVIAVFFASLMGSLHCVGMCGPFVLVFATAGAGPRQSFRHRLLAHLAYHGGRAATYIGLGALGGVAGAALDWTGSAAGLVHVAALISGVLVVLWGVGVWFPRFRIPTPLEGILRRRLVRLGTKPRVVRASLLGVFTPLLPCGWLYAFVVTAAGTGHAWSGAWVMAAFWLGTVPGLLGAGALFSRWGVSLRRRLPVLTGTALVLVGLIGVWSRWSMPVPGSRTESPGESRCH